MTDTTAPTGAIEAKTNRELLELAAKAAGMPVMSGDGAWPSGVWGWFYCKHGSSGEGLYFNGHLYKHWNPLTGDGDALRLAVKLQLEIMPLEGGGVDVQRTTESEPFGALLATESGPDPYAATRRCIVRAAAAIGRSL